MRRIILTSVVTLVTAFASYTAYSYAREYTAPEPAPAKAAADDKGDDTYKQLALFSEVFERVRRDYVKEVPDKQLVESAVNGMLVSLDPHSGYMNEDEFRDMQVQTKGEFGGLGLEVTTDNGVVKVVSPIDDTPAAKANLKPGDLIVAIDQKPVIGLTLNEAVKMMRGKPQSRVTLSIVRDRGEPFDVPLTRDVIKIKSVKYDRRGQQNDIGYIRVTQFTEATETGVREALNNLQANADKDNKAVTGIVLDLRNNPGGLLDQAIGVGSLFIDKDKEVVSVKGRNPTENRAFVNNGEPLAKKDLPMVVLINAGSASASEIVAGALQDHKRAVVMGVQSFGKGSVQTVMPVASTGGAIRLTTAQYYTPSGRSIQATGIKPDIEVLPAKLEEIKAGLTLHEADYKNALANPNGTKATPATPSVTDSLKEKLEKIGKKGDKKDKAPPADDKDDQVKIGDPGDYQLARALDLVHGLALVK